MSTLYKNLHQFTTVIEPMKLSMHLYLLLTEEPILVQTGSVSQAEATLPKIKELLGEKSLKYILVSHFESDECGGLSLVLKEFPQAITICSEVTARQLLGFGITNQFEIKKPGDKIQGKDFELDVLAYPSEMHLWEGLLFYETQRGIFFSSDLMFAMGVNHGQIVESTWDDAIQSNGEGFLPSNELQMKLINDLKVLDTNFVASGHGPCIKIVKR